MNDRNIEFESLLMALSRSGSPLREYPVQEDAVGALELIGSFLDGAFVVMVLKPETGNDPLRMFAGSGLSPGLASALESDAVQRSIAAQLDLRETVRLQEVSAASLGASMDPDPFSAMDIGTIYIIPLWNGGEVFGGLICAFRGSLSEVPAEDLRRAQCLGELVGYRRVQAERIDRLSEAVEAAEAGLWALELGSMTYWATDTAKQMHGFAADQLVNLNMVLSRVHPDDRGLIEEANLSAARAPGTELRLEYRVVQPDGNVRWMLARGRSDTGPGNPARVTGIVTDITDRRAAENELRDARALTDAVFDSVPGLIYLYTQDGRLVRWNRQHEVVSGYTAAELDQFPARKWFGEDEISRMTSEWRRVFEQGRASAELLLKKKDGTLVPYLFTGVRVEVDGHPHMVGIGIDITEQKLAESSVAALRNELSHVTRVTALGELASALAHELSQPLAAILSNAQAARRLLGTGRTDLAEVEEALTDIARDGKRAGEIVHGLRAMMAKGEAKRRKLDINALVQSVLALLNSEIIAAKVTPVVHLGAGLPKVDAGQTEMQHVLLNLIVNAIDAQRDIPEADRMLHIDTFVDTGFVNVAVRDAGSGIRGEDLTKVFEPFYTTKTSGLGMGLSICRRMVDTYDGRIWAENNKERGATFRIALPAVRSGTT